MLYVETNTFHHYREDLQMKSIKKNMELHFLCTTPYQKKRKSPYCAVPPFEHNFASEGFNKP